MGSEMCIRDRYGTGWLTVISLSLSAAAFPSHAEAWGAGSLFLLASTGRRTVLTGAFTGRSGLMLRGKNAGIL